MTDSVTIISLSKLSIIFIPVSLVIIIQYSISTEWKNSFYAIIRMLSQLIMIGYILSYIFSSDNYLIILCILILMISLASWIALGVVFEQRKKLYLSAFISILFGGGFPLFLVSHYLLQLEPWYMPRYIIPLAGMIFASSMTGISLAVDRLIAELRKNINYDDAKAIALKTALIPITNSLFAVGLVSIPGMMTGQILSGVSPIIAVRYQIMVMCMIYSAVGISSYLFLIINKSKRSLISL